MMGTIPQRPGRDVFRTAGTHGVARSRALRWVAWLCCLVALFVPFPLSPSAQAADPTAKPVQEGTRDDEAKTTKRREANFQLLCDLGHSERVTREQAYGRLLDIGPPVLEQLRFAAQKDNPERQRLALRLTGDLQDRYGIQPV